MLLFVSKLFAKLSVQVIASCDNTVDNEMNLIYTPNYPSNYNINEKCSWTILTSIEQEQIQLHFVDFQTMPALDKLYVYDGESSSSPLIRTYDGYIPDGSVPEDIISTGTALTLIFDTLRFSKSDTNYRGFEIRYFLKGNYLKNDLIN